MLTRHLSVSSYFRDSLFLLLISCQLLIRVYCILFVFHDFVVGERLSRLRHCFVHCFSLQSETRRTGDIVALSVVIYFVLKFKIFCLFSRRLSLGDTHLSS